MFTFQKRCLLTSLIVLLLCTCARAQDSCSEDDCGDLQVGFVGVNSEVVFCEGTTVELDNTSQAGFNQFEIGWGDGLIDTVFNYNNVSHNYTIPLPDDGSCKEKETFEIRYRGYTECAEGVSCQSASVTFAVEPKPQARMSVSNEVCAGRPVAFTSMSCNNTSVFWDFGDGTTSTEENPEHTYATDGIYTVSLTVTGAEECAAFMDVITRQVEIVNPPNALFAVSDDDLLACRGETITLTNQSNDDTNINWSISPSSGWMLADTSMRLDDDVISIIFTNDQVYTITLTGQNACETVEAEQAITIEEAPAVANLTDLTGCDEVVVSPATLGYNVSGNTTQICWEFPDGNAPNVCTPDFGPVTFTSSGRVILRVTSLCGDVTREAMVEVQSSEPPVLTAEDRYCTTSAPDTLVASSSGGNWSGPGITSGGIFDPSVAGVGFHTLTYAITAGACQNENAIGVEVIAGTNVTATDDEFCLDGVAANLSALPVGGTWSGTGITDPMLGTFEPTSAGVGTANPVYTFVDDEGCVITAIPDVTVFIVPEINGMDTALACLVDEAVSLEEITGVVSSVAGGNYRWTVNGNEIGGQTFNPANDLPGAGVYPVSYVYENGPCSVPGDLFVEVIDNPELSLAPQDDVCISEGTLTLGANLSGGSWSGNGIDPGTGTIDLTAAGGGTFEYTYSFQPGGSCAQTAGQMITIEDPGSSIMAGNDQAACENADLTTTLSGAAPAGGFWTGEGLTDANAGTVDLSQLSPGQDYVYTYNIESSSTPGCNAAANKTLAYHPEPNPNFTLDGSPCINESFTLEAVQTGGGFTYAWDFGDTQTSTLANPTHTYISGGTFTQTLLVTSPENCPADTVTTVYVTTPPSPAFTLDSTLGCAPFTLTLNDESTGDDLTSYWLVDADTLAGGGSQEVLLDGYFEDTEISVTLVAENFCGARTQVRGLVVKPYPAVDFGFATDDGCSPFQPLLSNVTRGNPDAFFWDMGEGTTSTDSIPPAVEYLTPEDSVSVYSVTLIAINECGRDTLVKEVTVHPPDVRAFIGLDTIAGCQPWTFEPNSFSTPGASLAWEVLTPDGMIFASGNEANPSFELTEVGAHRVILRAARCGSDADTVVVNVLPAPEVSFTADPAVCRNAELVITNTSSGVAGGFYTLGNGDSLLQLNGTVVYPEAGLYPLSFTGFSALNNCPASVTMDVVVNPPPAVAIAATDTSGCSPFTTVFSNVANANGSLTYAWDFDDETATSDLSDPSHTYSSPGTYFPRLTVRDEIGCTNDTFFSSIVVHPDPVPAFAITTDRFCAGYDSLQLTDASTGATALSWNINGEVFAGEAPVIPFTEAGPGTITLTATSVNGCLAETSREFSVLPSPTTGASALPDTACLGTPLAFSGNTTNTTSLVWNLGDGTGNTETDFFYTYGAPGDYNVNLIAANANGCPADTASFTVTINPLPEAGFTLVESVRCGTPADVAFINTSTGALSFQWFFDDGNGQATLNAEHTYMAAGTYNPRLLAETEFGCQDEFSRELGVSGAPVAGFIRPPALACSPYLLQLEAEPTEALRYEWYLDDAFAPQVGALFDTLLTENRDYSLRLIAIYDDVCRDTLTVNNLISLEPRPVAGFIHEADPLPNRLGEVTFQSTSTGGDELYWNLGDGTIRTDPSFQHEYRINRDIVVTHAITQRYAQGLTCSDTIRENVEPEWLTTFFVPNAISPQSGPDEVRLWGAKGFGVAEYTLEVFSAYGQIVFSTSELTESEPSGRWDGRLSTTEELALQGAYTWRASVTYVNGNTDNLVGTVTVVR